MKFSSKLDKKMARDISVDPPPPVSLGDTVANPPDPPPQECHVLFEWPLTNKSNTIRKYISLIF